MDDILKWALISIVSIIVVLIGAGQLGLEFFSFQISIFYILKEIGLLLLIYSASAATIEAAKYFRNKNRELKKDIPSGELQKKS